MNEIETLPDPESLAQAAAEHFVRLAQAAVWARGRFAVALAGGSTPRGMYARLAAEALAGRVEWRRVYVFWGDERCVPPDHPDSNYRMARETLLDRVPIPASNVRRMAGERAPEQAAAEYERTLRAFFGPPSETGTGEAADPPRFDLILLGLGSDGHIASLFPGAAALHERRRWVVAQHVESLQSWRITLTLPVINAAADIAFLVSGEGKAERLRQVRSGSHRGERVPAQLVNPTRGRLLWLVDSPAASLL